MLITDLLGAFEDNMSELVAEEDLTLSKLKIQGEEEVEDDEEDGDDGVDDEDDAAEGNGAKKKKKKKKKGKKKKKAAGTLLPCSRLLGGFTDYYVKYGQTEPPTIPIANLFPDGKYPEGQIMDMGTTKYYDERSCTKRLGEAERKLLDKSEDQQELYKNIRRAAECHRQVRAHAQSFIKPGIKLIDMCERLEELNRKLVQEAGLDAGIGFPTGCSLNHVAAHYTPNPGDNTVLQEGDVMKVDFGTQVDGRIIDCAWTVAFDPRYDPLLLAVREATECGVKLAGVDLQMSEIGEQIQEVMESHEIELNGTIYPIKCCRNLHGHSIGKHQIHAGKSVPIVKNGDTTRMEEGEFYAIETFGSTGEGYVHEVGDCSHFMREFDSRHVPLRLPRAKKLLGHINKTFGTLAFCKRWLERDDGGSHAVNGYSGRQEQYNGALQNLVDSGLVNAYPPLVDLAPGCYTAQYEHTLLLRPTCKEILSRGDDY